MNAKMFGRYAHASGELRPGGREDDPEWLAGWNEAETNRQQGRDAAGHAPNVPQLCSRDVRKVCNCCASCRYRCTIDRYPPPPAGRLGRFVSDIAEALKRLRSN